MANNINEIKPIISNALKIWRWKYDHPFQDVTKQQFYLDMELATTHQQCPIEKYTCTDCLLELSDFDCLGLIAIMADIKKEGTEQQYKNLCKIYIRAFEEMIKNVNL